MKNAGDSDEWWKQYGGEGVTPGSPGQGSTPQYPTQDPSGYPSAPQYPQQPSQPEYPNYQQPPPGPAPGGYPQPPAYGYPQGYQPYGYAPRQSSNGLAIGAMVTSIIGLLGCCAFFVPSLIGLVLGVVALNQMKQHGNEEGKGMAQAGVWVGVAGIVLGILYWALIITGAIAGW
ncbi:DUF4190 domain-containing protein [Nocardia puris]|uniref:Uncharacterized protein DUF4190 n=1 Tax=Nocardia puris TaxID=208602 RepID=A0A366D2Z3_9NOCA|nr:DUF4190 domain-containing protein [Nocardia puris]MBF6213845.1 DUF4190 domain-containing protein [Nocardia puris]MBF6368484.1 DUF4190 domain-containing protein [Nocardia puris]MBF6462971.1 DUF4190 domain-containing protein [Nocardia puris]RBO84285.1 uncharacterized protein DUF4190 [Nocardia puris]